MVSVLIFLQGDDPMSKTKRLETIDGESLMSLPLTPLNFVVDTLLSQGLHILAGSPKVGKSWLALWLSVMVAKGEPVWGMSVKQGTTLYLCSGGFRPPHPEPALRDHRGRTKQRPLLHGVRPHRPGAGGTGGHIPRRTPGHGAGHHRHAADGSSGSATPPTPTTTGICLC